MGKPKQLPRIGELGAWQEFRMKGDWYKTFLPPLCRFSSLTGHRWCLNLKTYKEASLQAEKRVEALK